MPHLPPRSSNGSCAAARTPSPPWTSPPPISTPPSLSTLGLCQQDLHAQLYGIRPDGSLTVGMATIRAAYRCAGLGWAIGWTALWPARPVCDALYRRFARNRLRIGRLLGRRRDDGAGDCGERCRL